MSISKSTKFRQLSDKELIAFIKEDQNYLGEVYKRCQSYSIQFMRKMTNGFKNNDDLEDVFQDAMLILYEKIVDGNFELTCSFQTYLNSVCRFQLLNKMKKNSMRFDYNDTIDSEDDESPFSFKSAITDSFEDEEDSKEEHIVAIEKALEKIKAAGGHCYELLTLFWYHKKSMNELTEHFAYSNADNTKNQKAKCQKRLQKIAFNEMKS